MTWNLQNVCFTCCYFNERLCNNMLKKERIIKCPNMAIHFTGHVGPVFCNILVDRGIFNRSWPPVQRCLVWSENCKGIVYMYHVSSHFIDIPSAECDLQVPDYHVPRSILRCCWHIEELSQLWENMSSSTVHCMYYRKTGFICLFRHFDIRANISLALNIPYNVEIAIRFWEGEMLGAFLCLYYYHPLKSRLLCM